MIYLFKYVSFLVWTKYILCPYLSLKRKISGEYRRDLFHHYVNIIKKTGMEDFWNNKGGMG
jgi:hypothetical protein